MGDESDGDTYCYWRAPYSYQSIGMGIERLGNKWMNGNHSN